jgi:hypothetical protein
MAKNKTKKNYIEDMDRDLNNSKFAREIALERGWPTEDLNEIVAQITLDAVSYLSSELVNKLADHVQETEIYEESNLAVLRLNEPWRDIVLPAIEDEFKETSKSQVAKKLLKNVMTLNEDEIKLVEDEGRELVSVLTTESFAPIKEFYERNTV